MPTERTQTARSVVSIRLSYAERASLEAIQTSMGFATASEAIRYCIQKATKPQHQIDLIVSELNSRSFIGPADILISAEVLTTFKTKGISIQPLLRAVSDCFRRHVLRHGFPTPPLPCSLEEALRELSLGKDRASSAYLKSVFPSYWTAAKGPRTRILEPGYLEGILNYRLGNNTSGETFDIGWSDFYRAVQVQKRVVSFFRPALARKIYLDHPAVRVWDPSCGFGGRMLAFHSVTQGSGFYYGNEPAQLTYRDNNDLAQSLSSPIYLAQQGSEFGHPNIDPGSIDLVFTSPPYFDKEKYFDEPTQAWFGRTKLQWENEYVLPTLQYAFMYLRSGGRLALNVPSTEPWLTTASKLGFLEPEINVFSVKPNVLAKAKGKSNTDELLITWEKP